MMESYFQGAFLGAAIGDALGTPAQGLKSGRVKQLFGRITGFLDPDVAFAKSPAHWRLKGLYTLTTQQILAVTESLILEQKFDIHALADTFRTLSEGEDKMGIFRGTDEVFRKAMQNLKRGGDPLSCGISHPGIGAAKRPLPLALFFKDNEEALSIAVIESSLLTHTDPRAIAGALAFASACARIAQDPEASLQNRAEFIAALQRFVCKGEEFLRDNYAKYLDPACPPGAYYAMSDSLSVLIPCLREKNLDLIKQTIIAEANRCEPPFSITAVNQDFAPSAITYALYLGLTARSFGEGVVEAINGGKEACAIGAMVGGILGLRFGAEAIPEEWRAGLVNAGQIAIRGTEMTAGFPDWSERTDIATLEREWTQREQEGREKRIDAFLFEKERQEQKHPAKAKPIAATQQRIKSQEEAPFAPPPQVVFKRQIPEHLRAKKEKAMRGKKRVQWKEGRRHKKKKKHP